MNGLRVRATGTSRSHTHDACTRPVVAAWGVDAMSGLLQPTDLRDPEVFVVCGFGSGFLPKMPGTWGSAVAVLLWWLFALDQSVAVQVAWIASVTVLGTWLVHRVCERYGVHDAPQIVVDEFVGVWIGLVCIPSHALWLLAAFGLFRLFDVWKPWPVGWADRRVAGALGVMLDDVLAGVLTLFVVQFALWALVQSGIGA